MDLLRTSSTSPIARPADLADDELDDDPVLSRMGQLVDNLVVFARQYCNLETPVEIVPGVTVAVSYEDEDPVGRFRKIVDESRRLADLHGVDAGDLAGRMLRADGWLVGRNVRSPFWMAYVEMPRATFATAVGDDLAWIR